MFCNQCGKQITINDKFCGGCGVFISKYEIECKATDVASEIPDFGKCHSKWWGWHSCAKHFHKPYDWLCDDNTLLVFDKYFVLIRGGLNKNRGVTGAEIPGILGGVFGAAILIKNKLISSTDTIDAKEFVDLYNRGYLIWGSKQNSEVWVLKGKKFLGIGEEDPVRKHILYCQYNSLLGKLDLLFSLNETDEYPFFISPIDNLGCKSIIKANVNSAQESQNIIRELLKDFPRFSNNET